MLQFISNCGDELFCKIGHAAVWKECGVGRRAVVMGQLETEKTVKLLFWESLKKKHLFAEDLVFYLFIYLPVNNSF